MYSVGYLLKQIVRIYGCDFMLSTSIACLKSNPKDRPSAKKLIEEIKFKMAQEKGM